MFFDDGGDIAVAVTTTTVCIRSALYWSAIMAWNAIKFYGAAGLEYYYDYGCDSHIVIICSYSSAIRSIVLVFIWQKFTTDSKLGCVGHLVGCNAIVAYRKELSIVYQ